MAIPVRLFAGLQNEIQMDLVVQTIDMSVERNISAFPTPGNYLKRFAIDTNTPRMNIEMNGIIIDDDGVNTQQFRTESATSQNSFSSTPMKTLINFGSMLPTKPFSDFIPADIDGMLVNDIMSSSNNKRVFPNFVSATGVAQGSTTTITVTNPAELIKTWTESRALVTKIPTDLEFVGSHSVGATGALTVQSSLTALGVDASIAQNAGSLSANVILNIGDRIINESGSFLGEVSALSSTQVTFSSALPTSILANDKLCVMPKCFNRRNELVGFVIAISDDHTVPQGDEPKYIIEFLSVTEASILAGDVLTINQSNNAMESLLHDAYIKIVPSYWLEDPTRNPKGSNCYNDLHMEIHNGYAPIGIKFKFDATKTHELLGGSDTVTVVHKAKTYRRSTTAGYPHQGSARLNDASLWDAIVNVPIKGIMQSESQTPASVMAQIFESAFKMTAAVSDVPMTNVAGSFSLTDAFTSFTASNMTLIEHIYRADADQEHPSIVSPAVTHLLNPQIIQLGSSSNVNAARSAGDKVQDLVGLVSNATADGDMFRGVQIPYDSLVTSSGVTATARNFFLTFGSLPSSEKDSTQNTRAASQLMNTLILNEDTGGIANDNDSKDFFEKVIDATVPDEIQSIFGFLVDVVSDIFVTLDTTPHGNDGGIRIMPEKLHVRHDAGNNYYAFTMVLVATDLVIGV